MQVRSFLLTLGLGMAAGGTVALMLPRQSGVRREAQTPWSRPSRMRCRN